MTLKALQFPVLDPFLLRFHKLLIGRRRPLSLSFNGAHYKLECRMDAPGFNPVLMLKFKHEGHAFWLELEDYEVLAKTFWDESIDLESLSETLRYTLVEYFVDEFLDKLELEKQFAVSLEDLYFKPQETPGLRHFFLTTRGSKGIRVGVWAPDALIEKGLTWASRIPLTPSNKFDEIEFSFRVQVGRTFLSQAHYRQLRAEDIILSDPSHSPETLRFVLPKSLTLVAQVDGTQVHLTQIMTDKTDAIPHEESDQATDAQEDVIQADEDQDHDVDDADADASTEEEADSDAEASGITAMEPAHVDGLAVELSFEAGRKRIPLHELKTLKAGYAFELDTPLDKPISIRANGKLIGSGELVQINDRVGVKVIAFTHS